jgi:hypothetical protein
MDARRKNMSIVVRDNGGSYEQPAAGMHHAVCARVYDLGEQPGFEGKPTHQVAVMWELEDRQSKGDFAGKRFLVTKKYTASLNEKAKLRKDLDSWRGRTFTEDEAKGFDLERLVGVNCLINIVPTQTKAGRTFMAVASVNPPMKGAEKLTIETDADYVPKFIQDLLAKEVYEVGNQPSVIDAADDEHIPF